MSTALTELLKAVAEPTRVRILNLLREGNLCVSDLQAVLALPQSTTSRHLATLRHTGLAVGNRRGTRAFYSLAPALSEELEAFHALLGRLCACDQNLKAERQRLRELLEQRRS